MAEEKKKNKQGRPKVYETPLQQIGIRLSVAEVARSLDLALDVLSSDGSRWPEFKNGDLPLPPSRSGVLRLAAVIGLRVLEERSTGSGRVADFSDLVNRERLPPPPKVEPVKKAKPVKKKAKAVKEKLSVNETRALLAALTKLAERLG